LPVSSSPGPLGHPFLPFRPYVAKILFGFLDEVFGFLGPHSCTQSSHTVPESTQAAAAAGLTGGCEASLIDAQMSQQQEQELKQRLQQQHQQPQQVGQPQQQNQEQQQGPHSAAHVQQSTQEQQPGSEGDVPSDLSVCQESLYDLIGPHDLAYLYKLAKQLGVCLLLDRQQRQIPGWDWLRFNQAHTVSIMSEERH